MKIGIIVQARMGSTRLPGKVLKNIKGKTILYHVIERLKQSKYADSLIIATTENPEDSKIEKEASDLGIEVYRGSESNVLSRYYYAAQKNNLDIVIRITSDCPVIDWKVLDELITYFLANEYDLVTNAGIDINNRTYPRGLDVEVFSFEILEKTYNNANQDYHKEHVTPYIYENSNNIGYYRNNEDLSMYRLTLDTPEDFKLINEIYKSLYNGKHDFLLHDVIELLKENPELKTLNSNVEQKEYNRKY